MQVANHTLTIRTSCHRLGRNDTLDAWPMKGRVKPKRSRTRDPRPDSASAYKKRHCLTGDWRTRNLGRKVAAQSFFMVRG
jgi:hypothetical protein